MGNFDDPPELPGLSHLLEHMLFLGTDQHPGENRSDAIGGDGLGESWAMPFEKASCDQRSFSFQPMFTCMHGWM